MTATTPKTDDNVIQRRRADDWKPATEVNTLIEHADGSVTLSKERLKVCLESSWELEALATILPVIVPNEVDGVHLAVRGIAYRIRSLSNVLMGGLFDDVETVKSLERKVFLDTAKEAA